MTVLFTILFCLSLAAGWAFSYLTQADLLGYLISLTVAGFIGSSLIALIFTYLYFYQKESDKEKIARLQEEIKDLQQAKTPVKRIGR